MSHKLIYSVLAEVRWPQRNKDKLSLNAIGSFRYLMGAEIKMCSHHLASENEVAAKVTVVANLQC